MLRAFIFTSALLIFPAELLQAQGELTHSNRDLTILLQKSKPDTQRVNLLLEKALVFVLRPGAEKSDMDSALYFTNHALSLSNKLNDPVSQAGCFRVYSQLYRESNQKEKGKNYIDKAISILTRYNQKESLGDAYSELQLYYNIYSDDEWEPKIKYAEAAERLFKESGNKLKQATTLKHLGDFYQIKGKDTTALRLLNEALAIYKSVNYQQIQGVYDLIGYVLTSMGDFNRALKYGLWAMETAEKLKSDSSELCTIYNRVGLTSYNLTRYAEAATYFTRSFTIAMNIKDTTAALLVSPNVMSTYLRMEKQTELLAFLQKNRFIYDRGTEENKADFLSVSIRAYLLTNGVTKAAPLVKPLLRLAESSTNPYVHARLYRAVIPYYFSADQYNEMYKYLPLMESYCQRVNFLVGLADNYLWWFKADSAIGNYRAAIARFKMHKEISDSSLRLTASRQINQLLVEYESLKKDQAIAAKESNILLLTKEARLRQEQLKRNSIVRNMTFSLIALLLVITALLYNRYRLKQRTNKKLELQQHEIGQRNLYLQQILTEKEWLLKEIHHRVKNNLQIVMSLLNSQTAFVDNPYALTAINDSQHRVHAMSLLHQKLYNSDDVSTIDMRVYIQELVSYLRDSFPAAQRIRFVYSMESVEMDVGQAVPLGLILNEAITNALKYAFPDERSGIVSISLSETAENRCELIISDDGIGMPSNVNTKKPGSLGMSLMQGLSEDLEGDFSIENGNGTTVRISFVHEAGVKKRHTDAVSFALNN